MDLQDELHAVNKSLRRIADRLHELEHRGDFGTEFVELSRSNLANEDLRETIKRRIDSRLRSEAAHENPDLGSNGEVVLSA